MTTTTRTRIGLYKTPSHRGSYWLRGELPDGTEVEVYANQKKNCEHDPDFWLEGLFEHEGGCNVCGEGPPPRCQYWCVAAAVCEIDGIPYERGAPVNSRKPGTRGEEEER